MESVVIKLKKLKKSELSDMHFVPKDRELIVEEDIKDSEDKSVYRFKVGDGMRPYSDLPMFHHYIHYSLVSCYVIKTIHDQ